MALSHHPHFPSLPLPLSVCLSQSRRSILPQQWPSHRETRQTSLASMTHSPTLRAPIHTTYSPLMTAHHTTPMHAQIMLIQGLLLLSLLLFSWYISGTFLSLSSPLCICCLVSASHCLRVLILPSASLYFHQPVLYILVLSEFVWVYPSSAPRPVCQSTCLSSTLALVFQHVPWRTIAKSKQQGTQNVNSPVCMLNCRGLTRFPKMRLLLGKTKIGGISKYMPVQ